MDSQLRIQRAPQLLIGLVAILLGLLFILDNLNLIEAWEVLRFWPVLFIAFGAIMLMQSTHSIGRFVSFIFMALGVVLVLNNLHYIRFRFYDLWPLLLVCLGISLVWNTFLRGREIPSDACSSISTFAVLGGVKRSCNSQDFRGGDITAILGGCEIDLRSAEIQAEQAVIQTFALWGGIEIKVPETWTVICEGFALLGGYEENTQAPPEGPRKYLVLRGFAIMGGVEVRN
mgnify:CR=1 FL=1